MPRKASPEVPPHEAHHRLRTQIESSHRERILWQSGMWYRQPRLSLKTIRKDMGLSHIQSCCNKSAPIYVLEDIDLDFTIWDLLYALLHNYIYRRWFQPYRTEIDNGQFLVQPMGVRSLPEGVMADTPTRISKTAHFVESLGRAICAHAENAQRRIGQRTYGEYGEGFSDMAKSVLIGLLRIIGPGALRSRHNDPVEPQRFLLVQPLFHAVATVLRGSDFDVFTQDISQIPVLLVLTGINEGLSAPITFDHIADQVVIHRDQPTDSVQSAETTLSTAVGFLIDLEKRELAAFGSKPDFSNEPRRSLFVTDRMLKLYGRSYEWKAADVPQGSSANWVDTDIYQEWAGEGAEYGEYTAQEWERSARRLAYPTARGEDVWEPL
ncbi:hypothetical protein F5144DRAFT_246210 [Chaetomium tenue]|uniref:Uncharacterized protein n=1 Tax=Chaetomium tenue TaxID=1854479 RepID=A0ACB7PCH3_9PEZI|nr:hypothetical protein F5144DRAFT_246210 [Chaetomium globosum]